MNLATQVRLKNSQLVLQRVALQQLLNKRVHGPRISSCWLSLVFEPFVVGIIAQRFLGCSSSVVHQICRLMFPSLRFWSIF